MLRPMLPTREAQAYRGLVREALVRQRSGPGWLTTRWSFALDGKPLRRDVENYDGVEVHNVFSYDADGEWIRPDVRTVRGADGSFTEYWSLGPAARQRSMGFNPVASVPVAFFVHGVAVVEAGYGADGTPIGVRFRGADGAKVSELVYRLDNHGRVVEVDVR